MRVTQVQVLPKKQFIDTRSIDLEFVYFLKQGHLKLTRMLADGKEVILDIVSPGEFFGELTHNEAPSQEIAEALDDATVCVFLRSDFEQILKTNPAFNREILKQVGNKLVRFQERMINIAFSDAESRVASFVLRYAHELGYLSHQEIAYLTGLSRQTVTMQLNDFRERGLITFDRSGITVLDKQALG